MKNYEVFSMTPDYVSIGKRLQEARKAKNLTQQQLANYMELSVSYVKSVENGKKPSIAYLFSVAERCQVSFDWILIGVQNDLNLENKKADAIFDTDLKRMVEIITELMTQPDERIRNWAMVQFDKAFRDEIAHYELEKKEHA